MKTTTAAATAAAAADQTRGAETPPIFVRRTANSRRPGGPFRRGVIPKSGPRRLRMTSFRRKIPADRPVCGKLTYGTTAQLRLRVSAVFLPNCAALPYFSRIMGRFSAFRSSSLTHSAASAGVRRRCSPVCMFFTEHLPAAISSSPSRTAKGTPSLLA